MYSTLLVLHSVFRWVALAAVAIAVLRATRGLLGNEPWTDNDVKVTKGVAHIVTAQAVLGILLYVVSPYIKTLLGDMSTTMHDKTSRLFAVEHGVMMLLALGFIHMGAALARKGADDHAKHKRVFMFFLLALSLMFYGMPWMRPLLRMGA